MSALPKQDLPIGTKVDFTGSGRQWAHLGQWFYRAYCQVTFEGRQINLPVDIKPQGEGYVLCYETIFSGPKEAPRLFADPASAADWYENLLFNWAVVLITPGGNQKAVVDFERSFFDD